MRNLFKFGHKKRFFGLLFWILLVGCTCSIIGVNLHAQAQSNDKQIKQQEQKLMRQYTLPTQPQKAPVVLPKSTIRRRQSSPPQQLKKTTPSTKATSSPKTVTASESTPTSNPKTVTASESIPTSTYNLLFNRSPAVGNAFHLRGDYAEARLGFTRPQNWKLQSAKALVRFQHSPALIPSLSNLTLRVNGTSVASVPLNRQSSEIGNVLFDIPAKLIQDYNQITFVAQQHYSADCKEENPNAPVLWTEILPDSQLIFDYKPQSFPLDFNRYPYPFFDKLSLDANQFAYLQPRSFSDSWLTTAARYSTHLGRLAKFQSLDTRLIKSIDEAKESERLVIIGTPEEQPSLYDLELPFEINDNQVLDGNSNALPPDVGVLMATTTEDSGALILVATGNGPEGVKKAVQFLVQPQDRQLISGQAIIVDTLTSMPSPPSRKWPGYLPQEDNFQLSDLQINGEAIEDITVRGAGAPEIEFDFKALPNDWLERGSYMNLIYSYGPQVNPRTSAVEVLLDDVFIGGTRLTEKEGEIRQKLKIDLPENLVKPDSKIKVAFRLNPKEAALCGQLTDQQLTGTLHADTSFHLNREVSVDLPNLKLLEFGFPFAAPQDLSNTAVVLPESPSKAAVETSLEFAKRLGKLSEADSVKLDVYTTVTLPPEVEQKRHLVGIGVQERFPFPEAFDADGFSLGNAFSRQKEQTNIQALADGQGVIKEIISPDNRNRVLLALTAQSEAGLERVQQLLKLDPWFFQLQGDTVLVNADSNSSPYDQNAYQLESFERATQTRRLEKVGILGKVKRLLQEHWYLLPTGIIAFGLIVYGIVQVYLKRTETLEGSN